MISGQKIMPELVPGVNPSLPAMAIVVVLAVVIAVVTKGHLGYTLESTVQRPAEAVGVVVQPKPQ